MHKLRLIPLTACLLLSLSACTDEMIITDPQGAPTTPNGAPKPPPVKPGQSSNTHTPAHLMNKPAPVKPGQNSLPPAHLSQKPMPGGYSVADPNDQDVFEANKFLEQELYARSGKEIWTKKILKAERQVVAGTNYRLTVLMSNGKKYQAVIYQDLQGAVELTSYKQI